MTTSKIAVIGLGYVGLPVALALAKKFPGTVGFDIKPERIASLRRGEDSNGDVADGELDGNPLLYTNEEADLQGADFFVVAVPTPIDAYQRPDLRPLRFASELVGRVIRPGACIVFESTVYPGVTEDFCGPIIAKVSGLERGKDFTLGYSPERINPGDREHTLERIVKVVSGEDEATLERVAGVYESIIQAGVHRAPSIKVAEAAKVIENTQRDLNIALMNELALIFDRIGISTKDVLDAAATKWNFLRFSPGLVGGHCIGVDPYYLTTMAEQLGYRPQVILAGRRINDGMGAFIAQRAVKLMIESGRRIKGARVGILGLTFKENVSDIRNSKIPDIVRELNEYGVVPQVHDPLADPAEAKHEFGITLVELEELAELDALIFAVAHEDYLQQGVARLEQLLQPGGVLLDVKACIDPSTLSDNISYWCL
ncbi:MAG: nucleotide sugar dehydrogenase [Bdellovibrionales bacterium]|nr:nucleotide sugar dehydrogenase [Bdellovibrionales bacterium]